MSSYFQDRMAELKANPPKRKWYADGPPPRVAPELRRPKKAKSEYTGKKGYIYFAKSGDLVKIGFASNPHRRVQELGTGNHNEIFLYDSFPSYQAAEKLLHRRFKADRVRGEWFRFSNDIEEFLEDLFDYQCCHAELPADDSGKVFLENSRKVFVGLEHLRLMLATLHQEWPAAIFEGANFKPDSVIGSTGNG
jgi:hypothetical protein